MRFRPDSDEKSCSKAIPSGQWYGDLACMRTAGHSGKCVAEVGDAARADGVKHCCRRPMDVEDHHQDCFMLLCPNVVDDEGRVCSLAREHEGVCDPGNDNDV